MVGGGGRGVWEWEHLYTRGGFLLMCGKTNTVLLEKNKKVFIRVKIFLKKEFFKTLVPLAAALPLESC